MQSKERVRLSQQQLAALGNIESRTQFGGYRLSVEKQVFAVVSDGELYLRACKQNQAWFIQRKMKPLILRKKGIFVRLNYYHVDEQLWLQSDQLVAISRLSLTGAQEEQQARQQNLRMKDLPNIGIRMELLLNQAGICNIRMLRQLGAKCCWMRLRSYNPHIGINTLLALQGAISGYHKAVLPTAVVKELERWYQHIMGRDKQDSD
ncbi:TfoX/Sxy family DNA transformation protein [Enterobacteriaceae bacterium LUAb1]